MLPIPGKPVSTPFGKRGRHWSCRRNSAGEGIHTGVDFAAPLGTAIVAPIDGQIRHRNYGSAFGRHQFAISPDPGQPFADGEVFFAHTRTRLPDGTRVKAGQKIAEVGVEGNTTGPHLHMEYMPKTKGRWTCTVQADPKPVIEWKAETVAQDIFDYQYSGKPKGDKAIPIGTYEWVTPDMPDPAKDGLEFKLIYLNLALKWKREGFGNVRLKFIREGGDATAYQDFLIHSSQKEFLITHNHFEMGEKGIGGKWYIKVTGDALESVTAGTRYSKYATVKDRG